MDEIGVELEVKERDAWIFSYDTMTRYPFQANTFGLPVDIVKKMFIALIENNHKKENEIMKIGSGICLVTELPIVLCFLTAENSGE